MQNWHRQFLGRTQMPPTLSGYVINEFFTLRQAELQAVLSDAAWTCELVPRYKSASLRCVAGRSISSSGSLSPSSSI